MSLNPKRYYQPWLHTEHDPEGPPPDRGTRWKVFRTVLAVVFVVLSCRLWQLQILHGDRFTQAAESNVVRRLPLEAQRGVFYDRNGVQLTQNTPFWEVSLTLSEMPDDERAYDAALLRLERRLNLGLVVSIDAQELDGSTGTVQLLTRSLAIEEADVRAALQKSWDEESPVLLADGLPLASQPELQRALARVPGVEVMLAVRWLVEHSGTSPYQPAVIATNVPREVALAIEGERVLLPGVSVRQVPSRGYPDAQLYAPLLGYTGKMSVEQVQVLQEQARKLGQSPYSLDETVGKSGLEQVYEGYLRGRAGAREIEVTSSGRIVREGKLTEATPGNNVVLTLDAGLQRASYTALQRAVQRSGASSGAVVALDPRNGEVLSLVSLPSYDNNAFIRGISQRAYERLQRQPGTPLLNKAISGVYIPGAVLEPFIAAGALAERVIDPTTEYECNGRIELPSATGSVQRDVYQDAVPRKLGAQNVVDALSNSCDVFFYIIAGPEGRDLQGRPLRYYQPGNDKAYEFHGLGIERINRFLANFGLGRATGIDLPGESSGLLADSAWKLKRFPGVPWTLSDTLQTAVGRGYTLVTPLQMAVATSAVANGGTVYQPRLLERVVNSRGAQVATGQARRAGTAGMTPDHLQTVREGMLQAAQRGTASDVRKRFQLPGGIQLAAKRGTPPSAQQGAGLPKLSWFTAFAPYERPEITVAVVISGGRSDADLSGDVAGEVLAAYFGSRSK
ncbi:MAG: penicillin-binding protein 2 [Chloroflexota bacterium]|nr:penicillin-binding protein 2 [Chloroflexota bacterium]